MLNLKLLVATGLSALLVLPQVSLAQTSAPRACLGAPQNEDFSQQLQRLRLQEHLHRIDEMALASYRSVPMENLEVEALQQLLGDDVRELYLWVRDNTRWLPYAGSLRGATGTLRDRSGSSLDRALLLAELLYHAGHEARLVRAPLTPTHVAQLQDHWRTRSPITASRMAVPDKATVIALAQRYQRDPNDVYARLQASQQATAQFGQRLQQTTSQQAAALAQLLGTDVGMHGQATAQANQVTEHWWVQWRGSQGWRDLDPSWVTQEFGRRWLAATGDEDYFAPTAVPDEAQHWLRVEIVAEQLHQGKLYEHVALSQRFRSAELTSEQLHIGVTPSRPPAAGKLVEQDLDVAALQRDLLSQSEWLPVIRINDERVMQQAILADGSVQEPTTGELSSAASAAMGSALGELSALGDAPQDDAQPPQLSAVYVRFYVQQPGQAERRYERVLMDVLATAERQAPATVPTFSTAREQQRSAQLMSSLTVLAQNHFFNSAEDTRLRAGALLRLRKQLQGFAYVRQSADFSLVEPLLADFQSRNLSLDQLAFLRFIHAPQPQQLAITELNLLGFTEQVVLQDDLHFRGGFDIIANPVSVLAADSGTVHAEKIRQGVLDTLLETELLPAQATPLYRNNTALDFATFVAGERDWQVLTEASDMTALDWPTHTLAQEKMRAALKDGHVLVAPQRLGSDARASWWQYDPHSGTLLGFDAMGRGGFVEGLIALMNGIDNASSAVEMAGTIISCVNDHEETHPNCCIAVSIVKDKVGGKVKDTMLGAAKGTWEVLFPSSSNAEMFLFEHFMSQDIDDFASKWEDKAENYLSDRVCNS
jgi:hypothetical protein